MKRNLIGIMVILVSLLSCERVIDIDLNEARPRIVIEATIHHLTGNCKVKITRTGNFFQPYSPDWVSGAKVSLSSDKANYLFTEKTSGIYNLNKTGRLSTGIYKLKVVVDEETYEAVSVMPEPVQIGYLSYEFTEKTYFREAGYRVNFALTDPVNEKNYYRVRYSVNGKLQNDDNDYYLINDELFNGNSVQMQLYGKRFDKDDTVTVELMSIDKSTFDYFNTLLEVISQNAIESAAPANPTSNFSNGALGYFSAYSSDTKMIIVGKTSQ